MRKLKAPLLNSKLIFEKKTSCGRIIYYPVTAEALKFVSVFKHSGGSRKVLTEEMVKTLIEVGVDIRLI